MSKQEPSLESATQLARTLSTEASRLVRRARKRKLVQRVVRAILWMAFTTFVVIPAMIAGGFLFGPRGTEGVIAAPAALFSLWAFILYWYFGRKTSARKVRKAPLAQLPATTGEWLDDLRGGLSHGVQVKVDAIAEQLEALTPQLQALPDETPAAHEIRRLLTEDLPELIRSYQKVPAAFRTRPLYGGKSPEEQLHEGLDTLERQVKHVHEQLAHDDLHAFAVHERYLALKYKRKDELD